MQRAICMKSSAQGRCLQQQTVVKRVICKGRAATSYPTYDKTADKKSSKFDLQSLEGLSYSRQYDIVMENNISHKSVIPKPSKEAQAQEQDGSEIISSDVIATAKRDSILQRTFTKGGLNSIDLTYTAFIGGMHLLAMAAPFCFSWANLAGFFGMYLVSGLIGITLGYHRLLSHKSFKVPKWLEYVIAYCGVMAVQGDPAEWVSSHRYHHQHCDTPLDPHSPYEGFWWSHFGWLLDNQATLDRVGDRSNASDMTNDPFYIHLRDHYFLHVVAQFAAIYLIGGLGAVVWAGALRVCWVHHITWMVNSVAHVWGYQSYKTDDLSRNNWLVAILAFGEGWHNNHHAFAYSARHGLGKNEFDMTWQVVRLLNFLGLADKVRLPTEEQKAKLAF